MPHLYLVLDLDARTNEALAEMPDDLPFKGVQALMLDAAINGPDWMREWRAFSDRTAAMAYARKPGSSTLVVIPMDLEAVPMDVHKPANGLVAGPEIYQATQL